MEKGSKSNLSVLLSRARVRKTIFLPDTHCINYTVQVVTLRGCGDFSNFLSCGIFRWS